MRTDACCCLSPSEEKSAHLLEKRMDEILSKGGSIHFKKGQVLFYEGHYPYGFFVLVKGDIELSRVTMGGARESLFQKERVLNLFHLITNTPHCATATAKTNVEVLFVPKTTVLEFLAQY